MNGDTFITFPPDVCTQYSYGHACLLKAKGEKDGGKFQVGEFERPDLGKRSVESQQQL